jgi:predicted DNA-binding ribbon-helix-helix protein
MWCNLTYDRRRQMAVTEHEHSQAKHGTRASVTFPAEVYAELERIAEEKKVSVAWVVRDAVEKYVEAQYPLFRQQ